MSIPSSLKFWLVFQLEICHRMTLFIDIGSTVDLYTLLFFGGQVTPKILRSGFCGVNSGHSTLGIGLLLGGFPSAGFRFGLGRFLIGFGTRSFRRLLVRLRHTPLLQLELIFPPDDQRSGTPVDIYNPDIPRLESLPDRDSVCVFGVHAIPPRFVHQPKLTKLFMTELSWHTEYTVEASVLATFLRFS